MLVQPLGGLAAKIGTAAENEPFHRYFHPPGPDLPDVTNRLSSIARSRGSDRV
jgi:hypothetical protein